MVNGPILVVDDEPINLAEMRKILEPAYPLIFAKSGADAVELAQQQVPSLILLDIRMPDMDGYQVCERLKAHAETQNIPVIFVTCLSDVGDEEAGFLAGCVDYLIKPLVPSIVRARVKTHLSLVHASKLEKICQEAIFMLGDAAHYNDDDTGDHIWRMASYAYQLAQALGWPDEQSEQLKLAAAMHDTGKIAVPERILKKPGPLDADEWEVMRNHTRIGYQILSRCDTPLFAMAAEIALCHHERWDGTGYPEGLAGQEIPVSARIVALVDVFDALSMKRSYKEPWPLEKIAAYLVDEAGKHFDPLLVGCFLSNLPDIVKIKTQWEG